MLHYYLAESDTSTESFIRLHSLLQNFYSVAVSHSKDPDAETDTAATTVELFNESIWWGRVADMCESSTNFESCLHIALACRSIALTQSDKVNTNRTVIH